ncbi:4542_t:CDS:2 [Acaulospora morrowiae]|uniref:chitin synthase n=1 Tax=Acaulospora morrowiae TaxID=94023 RepID=A0A9N8VIY5_9GLOM|nr:4542_t:CDS:2 [Acaulospora morrowiae]
MPIDDDLYQPPYSPAPTSVPPAPTRTPPPQEGAPPNPVTSMFNAITQNNVGLVRATLSKTNYDINNLRNRDGKTPLMVASSENCPDVVKYLCNISTVVVDLQDNEGETALYQAAEAGNAEVVEILIRSNAYVEIGNKKNITPLMIAAYNGHADVCRILIDIGYANVDPQDDSGKTSLTLASYEGHAQTVEVLLARGANVNIKDQYGWTALMLAAFSGRLDVCQLLLIHNADTNVTTDNGKTAVVLARDAGHYDVANLIENFVPDFPQQTPKVRRTQIPDIPPRTNSINYLVNNRDFDVPYAAPRGIVMTDNSEFKKKTIQPRTSLRRKTQYLSLGGTALSNPPDRRATGPHVKDMAPRDKRTPWVIFSQIVTACFLDPCLSVVGKMKDPSVQQAWREKVALCFIILCISCFMGFLTFGFSSLGCTKKVPLYPQDILRLYGPNVTGMKVHIVRGKLYNTGVYFSSGSHRPILPFNDEELAPIIIPKFGQDISDFFPPVNSGCTILPNNGTGCTLANANDKRYHCHTSAVSIETLHSLALDASVGYTWDNITSVSSKMFVYNDHVYDITNYLKLSAAEQWLGNANITNWLNGLVGKDATRDIVRTQETKNLAKCLDYFLVGQIEGTTIGCFATNSVLILMIVVFSGITLIKFISAVTFDWFLSWKLGKIPKTPKTDDSISRILLLVTCYSEGEKSMRTTLDSLASTGDYSDKHKLLFVIADGDVTGSENDKSTPQICKDLLEPFDQRALPPEAKSYFAIGDGIKQHNMAEVFIGYYNVDFHRVPMIIVNKVGTPQERKGAKAGNRGKRDSQLILMKWLSHIFFNERMSPLEFELFEKVRILTGATPDKYEMVLMVDADTEVKPDSVGHMVAAMERDPKVMGLCGETKIANKSSSWVTMIQVFEYYISHHLGKSFESIFGGVTCLPGCFCMYRIKVPKYNGYSVPILANPDIVEVYSSNTVETLHQKNLLLLGEDRYLTTLMLRTFPKRKMIYVPKAICKTVVPEDFKVLLSQRRRWINSTIHNLMELILVPQLCGIFCCSMQFVIFLELIGTVILPSSLLFILLLIIYAAQGDSVVLPFLFIIAQYFLQAFLVILTSHKINYVLWMLVFILAMPVWNFALPLYAFWHFDDFSWGATRKIAGEDNGHGGSGEEEFDSSVIETKRWREWKMEETEKFNASLNMNGNYPQMRVLPGAVLPTIPAGPYSQNNWY